MKKVETAKWEAQRPADKTEAQHAERMAQSERESYSLAKSVNDLELRVQQAESARAQLQERISSAQRRIETVIKGEGSVRESDLKRMMYRELGISWVLPDEIDSISKDDWRSVSIKCRVLARRKNDVYTLTFDDPKSDPCKDADRLWSLMSL